MIRKSKRKNRSLNQSLPLPHRDTKLISQEKKHTSAKEAKETKRKLSLEHRKKYPVSNGEILKFLTKKKTVSYLKSIFNEKIASERHNIVCQMFKTGKLDFGIFSPITKLSQAQFLEDDKKIDSQLSEIIGPILNGLNLSRVHGMSRSEDKLLDNQAKNYRDKYIYHVMVPEAIVKYIQTKNRWDKERAEQFYQDGESRVTNDELQEFDQELEEDAKRERERKAKEQYDTSDDSNDCFSFDNDEHLELPNIDDEEIEGPECVTKSTKTQIKVSTRVKGRKRSNKIFENGNG